MHLPILRLGREYLSRDVAELGLGGGRTAVTHTANPGLIRRDLLGIARAKAALDAIPADTLASCCERAADLFLEADLPCGDAIQSPAGYVESLSALTRLPHALVRMNMRKVHAAMAQVRTVIAGLTRNLPLEVFDRGLAKLGSLTVHYYPATTALGVSLPSNAPAVNSLWIPAPVMKIPVLLKPGREDPFTPLRIIQAMVAAGFPAEAFGYYPTTHEGGDTLLTSCGRAIAFGSDATVRKYAAFPTIQVHGTGRSKILVGPDMVDRWPQFLDVLVESVSANGGRSCINASAILVPARRDEIAEALAARLARIEPLPREHPDALLCGFADPALADGIDEQITAQLKHPGAIDVTARHRTGPRKVDAFGQTYLRPTLVSCTDPGHPLANTEFMFPFASIIEIPQHEMLAHIGRTLVVSAFTEDPLFTADLLLCPDIERLNLGPFPTNRVQWEQPHEGNLFEFLYHRRAIQGHLATTTPHP